MSANVNDPLVSIVMPVYNAECFLEEALCSVTEQSYKHLEIICVDDGSTDGSASLIRRFMQGDDRIRILSRKNGGAGAARNQGMEEARGEYVLFFDADDLLHKNAIGSLVKTAAKNDTDIVLFGYYKFSDGKKICTEHCAKILKVSMNNVISPEDIADRLFQADNGMPWNKFYKTDFLKKTGIRFQHLKNTNDEFFSRITTVEAKRILFLNRAFAGYRVGNKNSLRGNADSSILDCTRALTAIHDELKLRGYYDTYADTYKKLAGYVIMLKLLAIEDKNAFDTFVKEVCDNTLEKCGVDEAHLEDGYKGIYRALLSKDVAKITDEIDKLKETKHK